MKSAVILVIAGLLFALAALNQPYAAPVLVPDPHELDEIPTDCGNPAASIHENELAGFNCADLDDRLVGGYSRIRAGASVCNWMAYPEPDDPMRGPYGCSQAINAGPDGLPDGATLEPQTP